MTSCLLVAKFSWIAESCSGIHWNRSLACLLRTAGALQSRYAAQQTWWKLTRNFHRIGYVSATLHLRPAGGADMFHFSLCVNPHQVCCATYLLRPSSGSPEPSRADKQVFCFWQMLEHDTAIQLNLARSRQEVKRRNNKQHPVTFQNKTLRVDTSTQISKKRQTQALLLILWSGTLCVVVFNNTDL